MPVHEAKDAIVTALKWYVEVRQSTFAPPSGQ